MLVAGKELDFDKLGINNVKEVYRNLSVDELIKETVENGEGVIGPRGATIVDTGKYTGRSPKDKYIVDESTSTENVWWGDVNQKLDESIFDELYNKIMSGQNRRIIKKIEI